MPPEQAFGSPDPDAVVTVSKTQLPDDARQKGAVVETDDDDGNIMAGEVISLSEEMAVIDFNHPLAGKTIQFDIRVLSVTEGGA